MKISKYFNYNENRIRDRHFFLSDNIIIILNNFLQNSWISERLDFISYHLPSLIIFKETKYFAQVQFFVFRKSVQKGQIKESYFKNWILLCSCKLLLVKKTTNLHLRARKWVNIWIPIKMNREGHYIQKRISCKLFLRKLFSIKRLRFICLLKKYQ